MALNELSERLNTMGMALNELSERLSDMGDGAEGAIGSAEGAIGAAERHVGRRRASVQSAWRTPEAALGACGRELQPPIACTKTRAANVYYIYQGFVLFDRAERWRAAPRSRAGSAGALGDC